MEHRTKKVLALLLVFIISITPALFIPAAAVGEGRLIIEGRSVDLPGSDDVTYENTDEENSDWWLSCQNGQYTLTLKNVSFTEGIYSTIKNLDIFLPGGTVNTIFSEGSCLKADGSLRITGGGKLTVSSNATDNTAAVYASDNLMVSGAELNVTSSSATGLWGGTVSIDNGTVKLDVSYGGTAECAGIFGGRLSVSNSIVAAGVSGGAVARAVYSGSGIKIADSDFTANAYAVSGGVGIAAQSGIALSGGNVNAFANSKGICAVGIDNWSNSLSLTVARGCVKAEGICADTGRRYAYGIRTHLLYAAGGFITADGTDGGIAAGNNMSDGITLGKSVKVLNGGSLTAVNNGVNYYKTFAEDKKSLAFLGSGYVTGGASPVVLKSSITALSVTGTARVGQRLTAVIAPNSADADYKWFRSDLASGAPGTEINGAVGSSYILTAGDLGKYVYCRVSGIKGFDGTAVSKRLGKIKPSPNLPLSSVTVSGIARAGCTLKAQVNPAGASALYSWFRSGGPGAKSGSVIEGAQSPEYTLTDKDAGMYIYCEAHGWGDYAGTVCSAAVGAVEEAPEGKSPALIYVPLDNRSVNVDRVVYEAESAGFKVYMPGEDLYATRLDGQPRNSNGTGCGDGKALLAWIKEMDEKSNYFVLSLDQLLSGGLVNSRVTANTDLSQEYAVIDALAELSRENHVYILDTVPRLAACTVGYKGGDTADYSILRAYYLQARPELKEDMLTIDNIVADYRMDEKGDMIAVKSNYERLIDKSLLVRERKLRLIDYILRKDAEGKMRYFIGVDDSNSKPTVQTNEIAYIRNALGSRGTIYSGTDELGMMAVTRLMMDYYGSRIKAATVYFGGTENTNSGSAYDIETIRENVEQHLKSVGVSIAESKDADLEMIILTPPAKQNMSAKYITRMLDRIKSNITSGVPTIVINPVSDAYGNNFEFRMVGECEMSMLLAYSSWGTSGNAIGLATGNGISRYLYLQSRSRSSSEADAAFLKALVFSLEKDISYIRGGGKSLFTDYLTARGLNTSNFYLKDRQAATVSSDLETLLKSSEYNVTVKDIINSMQNRRYIKGLKGECGIIQSIELSNFSAPFYRTNEIRFDIGVSLSKMTINGFGDKVTVTLPYKPAKGELLYNLNVYYQDTSGTVRKIPCRYDQTTESAVFTVSDISGIFLSSMSIVEDKAKILYSDVPSGSWYFANVLYAGEKGLMKGMNSGIFRPQAPMTRTMLLSALYRIAPPAAPVRFKSPFSDVSPDDWCYDAALWAFESGIATGHTDGRLGTDESMTRQETASLMYRLAAYLKADVSLTGNTIAGFKDGSKVQDYARTAFEWALERGIISGEPGGMLLPRDTVTRAQAAAMLQRLCSTLNIDD